MSECRGCVNYDPADGYCVMHGVYVHADGCCGEHRNPKKWLYLMTKPEEYEEEKWRI